MEVQRLGLGDQMAWSVPWFIIHQLSAIGQVT